ncbi:hypothetical protein LINGRAHAP2_LOCUS30617 [Linum grandiflorum]
MMVPVLEQDTDHLLCMLYASPLIYSL